MGLTNEKIAAVINILKNPLGNWLDSISEQYGGLALNSPIIDIPPKNEEQPGMPVVIPGSWPRVFHSDKEISRSYESVDNIPGISLVHLGARYLNLENFKRLVAKIKPEDNAAQKELLVSRSKFTLCSAHFALFNTDKAEAAKILEYLIEQLSAETWRQILEQSIHACTHDGNPESLIGLGIPFLAYLVLQLPEQADAVIKNLSAKGVLTDHEIAGYFQYRKTQPRGNGEEKIRLDEVKTTSVIASVASKGDPAASLLLTMLVNLSYEMQHLQLLGFKATENGSGASISSNNKSLLSSQSMRGLQKDIVLQQATLSLIALHIYFVKRHHEGRHDKDFVSRIQDFKAMLKSFQRAENTAGFSIDNVRAQQTVDKRGISHFTAPLRSNRYARLLQDFLNKSIDYLTSGNMGNKIYCSPLRVAPS